MPSLCHVLGALVSYLMPAYKRTDPGKLAREREAIRKSQTATETGPRPTIFEPLLKKIEMNRLRRTAKRRGFGPAPQIQGALVKVTKPERTEA